MGVCEGQYTNSKKKDDIHESYDFVANDYTLAFMWKLLHSIVKCLHFHALKEIVE